MTRNCRRKRRWAFDQEWLSPKAARQVQSLLDGSLLDRRENVLAVGNSGAGKTHLECALGQELIRQRKRSADFSPCSLLVQELLLGKRELKLSRMMKRLSN